MEKKVDHSVLRKRGRPAGKNRVPLSLAERRARNAQYERERREGLADQFADLAAAVGVSGSMSNSDLLATVITHLRQASLVKHSSDVESLTRCNKNLLAQIEKLERQLAEPDQGCSAFQSQTDDVTSRPAKRKRNDDFYELPLTVPVPEHSPQESKYTPPPLYPGEGSARTEFMEQEYFPLPSPSPAYLPVQAFIPGLRRSPQSTLAQDQDFESSAPNHLLKQEFVSTDPWLPNAAMSAEFFLPVPKLSPVSNASDQHDRDFDHSPYHFAESQIPTPEYHVVSTDESSGYIHPAQLQAEQMGYHQPSEQCHLADSSSEVKFSQYLIPEACQGSFTLHSGSSSPDEVFAPPQWTPGSQQPYVCRTSAQPSVVGSVEIIPMPGSSGQPDVDSHDPGLDGFLPSDHHVSMSL